ncbi:hypothetical protein [Mycetocola reblochoni]|uniref:Aminoglycoside phosphotransferase domain-containing protein n=2 Tax=Mycetocola reblochoni TaxID=331618 RepID=A0A1R4K8J2_9MICO|nr:hypothetical protein [Mycetocola reblochoni]RLP68084.1 hypothetical protein D9V30_11290 [Mycetocola reblochoni]SJN40640.1 hypothetical protein FM119_12105 [Mycetocola reblochoni REB411]
MTPAATVSPDVTGIPSGHRLLDEAGRAELLGADVTVARLRFKPRHAIVMALHGEHGPRLLQAYADPVKAAKTRLLAREHGILLTEPAAGVLVGPAGSDRVLARLLHRVGLDAGGTAGTDGAVPTSRVAHREPALLKHNPLRRLVMSAPRHRVAGDTDSATPVVAKLMRHTAAAGPRLHAALAAAAVPVLPLDEHRIGRHGVVQHSPYWGDGSSPDARALGLRDGSAGAPATPGSDELRAALADALHRVHAAGDTLPALSGRDPAAIARTAVDAIRAIAPSAADAAHHIAARALDAIAREDTDRLVPIHGDLSPDQLLREGTELRLIDWDRCRRGTVAEELGGLQSAVVSTSLLAHRSLVPGAVAGPEALHALSGLTTTALAPAALGGWIALGLLARAVEPFRGQLPEAARLLHDHVHAAEEAME